MFAIGDNDPGRRQSVGAKITTSCRSVELGIIFWGADRPHIYPRCAIEPSSSAGTWSELWRARAVKIRDLEWLARCSIGRGKPKRRTEYGVRCSKSAKLPTGLRASQQKRNPGNSTPAGRFSFGSFCSSTPASEDDPKADLVREALALKQNADLFGNYL